MANEMKVVRAYGAGVFYGKIVERKDSINGVNVIMENVRRIHYWEGAASLSQIAMEGVRLPKGCRISVPVDRMEIMNVIEIIDCTDAAVKNLDATPIWRINAN